MEINILMLTDDNYISQTKVTMYSVCKNTNSKTKITFTILCDKSLDRISRKRLTLLEVIFPNIKVNFYEVEVKDLINAKSNYRVPKISYYRLIGAKVLNVEKAICLDSDLIVEMDLTELYEIDIEDYYIAGVRDLYTVLNPNFALWYADNYNIKNFSDYINCGVLLMNLKLMNKDNIVEKFLDSLEQNNLWLDQDIFNRVCSGKICLIDWRFNHVAFYTNEEYEWNYKALEKKESKEIIHYCGPGKPWEHLSLKMADIWWNVAKNALEKDIYERLYRKALIGKNYEKFEEIINKCLGTETVAIVGYSDHGIFVKNTLLKCGVNLDIVFCDNNPKKRELMLSDKKVYSPEEVAQKYKNAVWVNVVQNQRNQIIEQLRALEIPDRQVVNYIYE